MIGSLVGLVLGLGLLLMWRSGPRAPQRRSGAASRWHARTAELLAQADLHTVRPAQLVAASAGAGAVAAVVMVGLSRSVSIAACFGAISALGPWSVVRWRQRQRAAERRSLWPEAVENLSSGVRAGLALPEALAQLGVRGPEPLREPFRLFGEDYRASGRFSDSLDLLKARLADPVGDRIVEALRLAREVGGTDLGRLLRTLATFLRDDARTRAELETRQSWTVNAARLAVASPWLLLAILSLRPEAVAAYNTPAGALVLGVGAGLSVVAYRVMKRIARLPTEARVLK